MPSYFFFSPIVSFFRGIVNTNCGRLDKNAIMALLFTLDEEGRMCILSQRLGEAGAVMKTITTGEGETVKKGKELGSALKAGDIVALYGDLGAGKTAFTRGIAAGLGIKAHVSSPTFTIVNEYPGKIPLFHFDLYRLADEAELFDIGWHDYLERGGVCVIEWSEKAATAMPPEAVTVNIEIIDGDTRGISCSLPEA